MTHCTSIYNTIITGRILQACHFHLRQINFTVRPTTCSVIRRYIEARRMGTRRLISQLNRIAARSRELSWPFFAGRRRRKQPVGVRGSKHYVSYSRDGNKTSNDRATENATRALVSGMTFAAHSRRGTDREFHVRPNQRHWECPTITHWSSC